MGLYETEMVIACKDDDQKELIKNMLKARGEIVDIDRNGDLIVRTDEETADEISNLISEKYEDIEFSTSLVESEDEDDEDLDEETADEDYTIRIVNENDEEDEDLDEETADEDYTIRIVNENDEEDDEDYDDEDYDDEDYDDEDEAAEKFREQKKKACHEAVDKVFRNIVKDIALDEEVIEDLRSLFSAALEQRAEDIAEDLVQDIQDDIEMIVAERIQDIQEQAEQELLTITENIDKYLSYAAKEWLSENKLEVQDGIKVSMAESLISSLKGTLIEHNIAFDDEIDVSDAMIEKIDEQENEIEALQEQLNEYESKLKYIKGKEIIESIAENSGMTETQKERFINLVESTVPFTDSDSYERRVTKIRDMILAEDDTSYNSSYMNEDDSYDDNDNSYTGRYITENTPLHEMSDTDRKQKYLDYLGKSRF